MQVQIPQVALEHDFLMHGILAVAALDIAISHKNASQGAGDEMALAVADSQSLARHYARAAIEYYGQALPAFRGELARHSVTPENHLAVIMFSTMAALVSTVLPRVDTRLSGGQTTREAVVTMFEMMNGAGSVAAAGWKWMVSGAMITQAWKDQNVPLDKLRPDEKAAIARLYALNDVVYGSSEISDMASDPEGSLRPRRHRFYRLCIEQLEELFARALDGSIRAVCLAWPNLVGTGLVAALRRSEPLALVLAMHWAVLMQRLSVEFWWVDRIGLNLVDELSEALMVSSLAQLPGCYEGIAWTRSEVGLPELIQNIHLT
jgi:hypothetical protein